MHIGKGNLVHRNYGKNVFTFVRRSDGRGVHIITAASKPPLPGKCRVAVPKAKGRK